MDQVELTACRLLALAFTDCGASTRAQKAWCWLMFRRGVIRQAHQSPSLQLWTYKQGNGGRQVGTSNYHQLSFCIRLKNSISKSLLKFMSSNILPILQRENKKGYSHYITTTGKKKNHHLHAFAMCFFFIFIVLFQLFAKNKHIMRGRRALPPPREVYLPALAETRVLVVCWRSLLQGFGSVPLPPFWRSRQEYC